MRGQLLMTHQECALWFPGEEATGPWQHGPCASQPGPGVGGCGDQEPDCNHQVTLIDCAPAAGRTSFQCFQEALPGALLSYMLEALCIVDVKREQSCFCHSPLSEISTGAPISALQGKLRQLICCFSIHTLPNHAALDQSFFSR